jgi:plastocyanin
MKFSVSLAAALFVPVLVNAQYDYPPASSAAAGSATSPAAGSTAATPTASAIPSTVIPPSNSTNINVQVAPGGQLVYNPNNFTASNGTTVTFFFLAPIMHSVTQSSFGDPCTPLAANGSNSAGFDSGLQTGKEFSITVTNDQQPIWFFCKMARHCGSGFVGSINAPTTGNTFDAFLTHAKAIGTSETLISDSGPKTGGFDAVATNTPVPVSTTPATSASATSSAKNSSTHVVASGFMALLAAAFGITLA